MPASGRKFTNMDEYIGTFPKEIRNLLNELRQAIRETAPEAQETIKYQMPTFTLHGNLVSFAAWKNHIALYPIPAGTEAFRQEISAYKGAKSTARFPMDQPLPLRLIRRLVKYRVEENIERSKSRKNKASIPSQRV